MENQENLKRYRELIQANPSIRGVYIDIIKMSQEEKIEDKAISFFNDLLSTKNANILNIKFSLGLLYLHKKEYKKALDQFIEALEIEPDNFEVKQQLAKAFCLSGEYARAVLIINELVALFPHSIFLVKELIDILKIAKDYNGIIKACNESIERGINNYEILIELADAHKNLNEATIAVDIYEKTINMNRFRQEAYDRLYNLLKTGNFNVAEKFEYYYKNYNDSEWPAFYLVGLSITKNDFEKVFLYASKVLSINSDMNYILNILENIINNQVNKEIVEQFTHNQNNLPANFHELMSYANNYFKRKIYDLALESYLKIFSSNPTLEYVYLKFARSVQDDKGHSTVINKNYSAIAGLYEKIADAYVLSGDFKSAVDNYQKHLMLYPENFLVIQKVSEACEKAGNRLLSDYYQRMMIDTVLDEKTEELNELTAVIVKSKNNYDGYIKIARHFYSQKEFEYSLNVVNIANSIDFNPENLLFIAKLYDKLSCYDECENFYEEYKLYNPLNYKVYLDLGTFYYFQKNFSGAEKNLLKAVDFNSEITYAYVLLTDIYTKQKDIKNIALFANFFYKQILAKSRSVMNLSKKNMDKFFEGVTKISPEKAKELKKKQKEYFKSSRKNKGQSIPEFLHSMNKTSFKDADTIKQAKQLFNKQSYGRVVSLLQTIKYPGRMQDEVYELMGNSLICLWRFSEAIDCFEKASIKAEQDFYFQLGKVVSYACMGLQQKAYLSLVRADALNNSDPGKLTILSKFFKCCGDDEYALICDTRVELLSYPFYNKKDVYANRKPVFKPLFKFESTKNIVELYKEEVLHPKYDRLPKRRFEEDSFGSDLADDYIDMQQHKMPQETYEAPHDIGNYYEKYDREDDFEIIVSSVNCHNDEDHGMKIIYSSFVEYFLDLNDSIKAFDSVLEDQLELFNKTDGLNYSREDMIYNDTVPLILKTISKEYFNQPKGDEFIEIKDITKLYNYVISRRSFCDKCLRDAGIFYYKINNYKKALKNLERAFTIDSTDEITLEYLIKTHLQCENYQQAEILLDRLSLKSNYKDKTNQLIRLISENILNLETSFASFIAYKIVSENPDDFKLYSRLIALFYKYELFKPAAQIINAAISAFPEEKDSLYETYPNCRPLEDEKFDYF